MDFFHSYVKLPEGLLSLPQEAEGLSLRDASLNQQAFPFEKGDILWCFCGYAMDICGKDIYIYIHMYGYSYEKLWTLWI